MFIIINTLYPFMYVMLFYIKRQSVFNILVVLAKYLVALNKNAVISDSIMYNIEEAILSGPWLPHSSVISFTRAGQCKV